MKFIVLVVTFILSLGNAYAFPEAPIDSLDRPDLEFDISEMTAEDRAFDFNGIVRLSNCSGSIVHFQGQPMDSYAFMMTNGHCIGGGFLKPGEVKISQKSTRRFVAYKTINQTRRIRATELVYATMTDTDMAFYRLDQTYTQLKKAGIESFEVIDQLPQVGTPIDIVSGYWKKGYACNIDGIVYSLKEADWLMYESIRYSDKGCEVIGGTSGSPIVARGTRMAIGVNNTGNMQGRKCTLNNPCEIDEKGNITYKKGLSYGQQIYKMYGCLTNTYDVDMNLNTCDLPQ